MLRSTLAAITLVHIAACSTAPMSEPTVVEQSNVLFHAANTIQDKWQHMPLRGETDYRIALMDGQIAIRAIGRNSASGLIRRVSIDPAKCPIVEWSWCVTKIQPSANLRVKEKEDVAASIFLLFGDPGFLFDPKPVPTLRYVWTNENASVGAVIDNPYLPGVVRSVVVESGVEKIGKWVTERRNVIEDFIGAFGHRPTARIHALVIFTDNDQTAEPVEAYYGFGRAHCVKGD